MADKAFYDFVHSRIATAKVAISGTNSSKPPYFYITSLRDKTNLYCGSGDCSKCYFQSAQFGKISDCRAHHKWSCEEFAEFYPEYFI